jgi:REP element-mobilizing transposase RayT
MSHTYTRLLTHIIFSTKNREPWLSDDVRPRLFPYMGGIIRDLHGTAILANGPADHVHALCTLPPTAALCDVMRVLKSNSSKWLHDTFPDLAPFAWQTGYGAFSVSESNAAAVEQYIANQQEHHRSVSFQEEFLAFLKRHGIRYDPRYVWE